jgi:hypothetical protein
MEFNEMFEVHLRSNFNYEKTSLYDSNYALLPSDLLLLSKAAKYLCTVEYVLYG